MADYNLSNYKVIEGNIASGTLDRLMGKGSLLNIVYISIDNDSTTNGIVIKFDSVSNDEIPILPGENVTINNISFINAYLSNRSDATVHYRILIIGNA